MILLEARCVLQETLLVRWGDSQVGSGGVAAARRSLARSNRVRVGGVSWLTVRVLAR